MPFIKRQRVTLFFVQDGRLLLIERFRDGRSFHVLPGGGVEPGETLLQAAHREAKEETNLEVVLSPLLWQREVDAYNEEFAFAVTTFQGTLQLGGPEAAKQSPTNRYKLVWIPLSDLSSLTIWPGPLDVTAVLRAFS